MFKKIRYKLYQKWFCKQYVQRSMTLPGYKSFLKRQSKRSDVRGDFISVAIYDVLDNNGMHKLVKSLYRLKKQNEYRIEIYYFKHSFKKINYIHSNMTGGLGGGLCHIKFKDDKWISEIQVRYTTINNSEAIIEYCFYFKKIMCSYAQIHGFVMDNIIKSKKPSYFHTYADKSKIKKANYYEIFDLDDIFFADILQAYICDLFYTKLGNKYKLPVEYSCKIYHYNYKTSKKLRKSSFLQESYEKDKEYLIFNNPIDDRREVAHYYSGNFKSPMLRTYFTLFSPEFYYKVFMGIELDELEIYMRKYLNSRKRFVNSRDMKWLINKIRYIQEREEKIASILKQEFIEVLGWSLFWNGEKLNQDLINYPTYTNHFKLLYNQNLEYLNSLASVQNDKIIIIVTITTLIATIVSIAVTLFSSMILFH